MKMNLRAFGARCYFCGVMLDIALFMLIILLIIILPQLNNSSYINPTVTSKFLFFGYACIVLFGLYMVKYLFKKEYSFSFSRIDLALLIMVCYISINRYCIQDHYGFSIRYMELLGLSIFYLILKSIHVKNYSWIFLVIIVSGTIQAVYGNLQLLGFYASNHSGFKMTGSFFNPGPYAGFLSSVWPLALGVYLFREPLLNKMNLQQKTNSKHIKLLTKYVLEYMSLIGLVSIALVLPASQSRAAWLAVICSSVLLLEFRYAFTKLLLNKLSKTKKKALGILTIAVITILVFGIYHFKKGSSDGRLFIWKVTTNMIADTPVFGVGFDKFKTHYMNYQGAYFKEHGETSEALVTDNTYYAFNEFLQFFSENGVMGFLILTIILYTLIKISKKKEHIELYVIAMGTLLSIAIFASFSYAMQILPIKIILIFMLSLMACLEIKKFQINFFNVSKIIHKTVGIVALGGVIFIVTVQVNFINKLEQGFKTWQEALTIYNYGDYGGSLEIFKQAYAVLHHDGDFLANYGKALTMAKQNKEALEVLENAKSHINTTLLQTALGDAYKGLHQYNKAEEAYNMAYNMIPTRFYPLYLLANLYDESEQPKKATNMAEKILNKEVKIPSTAIKEIQAEMKKMFKKQIE